MTMRPFYRSRLFWLGVPGLVFLLWVWWDSGKYESMARWIRGEVGDTVRVTGGLVEWQRETNTEPAVPMGAKTSLFDCYRSVRAIEPWFDLLAEEPEAPAERRRQFDFREAVTLGKIDIVCGSVPGALEVVTRRVALWVVVAGYGVMWLGAVCWWQRRKTRVMRRLTEMEVAS